MKLADLDEMDIDEIAAAVNAVKPTARQREIALIDELSHEAGNAEDILARDIGFRRAIGRRRGLFLIIRKHHPATGPGAEPHVT